MKETVYTITIGALPDPVKHKKMALRVRDFIQGLEGLITLSPVEGYTILGFRTINDAKIARNLIEAEGNPCSMFIMRAELDRKKNDLLIIEPIDADNGEKLKSIRKGMFEIREKNQ